MIKPDNPITFNFLFFFDIMVEDSNKIFGHFKYMSTAAPTTGTWLRGDIVYNATPSAAGTIGWICVTAGTPGTWKTFGAISA